MIICILIAHSSIYGLYVAHIIKHFLEKRILMSIFYYFLSLFLLIHFIKSIDNMLYRINIQELTHEDGIKKNKFKKMKDDEIKDLLIRNNKILTVCNNTNIKCIICFEKFDIRNKTLELKCKHIYCIECLAKWCKIKNECPLCRNCLINDDFY